MDKMEFLNNLVGKMKELSNQAKQVDIPQALKSSVNSLLLLALKTKKESLEAVPEAVERPNSSPIEEANEISFLRTLIKREIEIDDKTIDDHVATDKKDFKMTEVNSLKALLRDSGINKDDHPKIFINLTKEEDEKVRKVITASTGLGRPELAKRVEIIMEKGGPLMTVVGALLVLAENLGVKVKYKIP